MKLKTVITALLCSAFVIGAGGCSITDFSAENLLRPPKAMGDEAEIEQLISETATGSYTLKYPKNGSYRSAIIMTDLNGDEEEEAVAFYRSVEDTAQIHMLVMYSDNGAWKLSSDNVTEATDIDSVDFADINGNGMLEIFAGFTTYTPNINYLACYSYNNGKTSEIHSGHSYSSFYSGDFDSDGNSEIMTLLLYTAENEATASMLDYSKENNSLYAKAMVNMDPNVTKYKNVSVSLLDDSTKGLVVDGSYANEELNTQVIFYSKELSLLRNPLYKEKSKNATQRISAVTSSDIDKDGKVEIPVVSKLPCPKGQEIDNIADKIVWNSFSTESESISPIMSVAANYDFNFYFKMPDKWQDNKVTAVTDNKSGLMEFYEFESLKLGKPLFEIKVFSLDEYNAGKDTEKYTLISKDDKYAYAFNNINADSPVSLTDDEIKTSFMALTEATV